MFQKVKGTREVKRKRPQIPKISALPENGILTNNRQLKGKHQGKHEDLRD